MSNFLQLHLLTVYGPSNLNRDDTGRPKTAIFGGVPRLRISSQSLKRAWRESPVFEARLAQHLGSRTQRLGEEVYEHLIDHGVAAADAVAASRRIAGVFGKLKEEGKSDKKKKGVVSTHIEQLAFISPEERAAALTLADKAIAGEALKVEPDQLLRPSDTAADIAMFGRMLADNPAFNREAAVQVAHAITTHRAIAEDDYYTAVDDLKKPGADAGAGFLGVSEFGAGVFYLYICVDRGLLEANLGGNRAIRNGALMALVEAAATTGPRGKQSSFASRAKASYILAEAGDQAPRSLVAAFLNPVNGSDYLSESIARLTKLRNNLDQVYGSGSDAHASLDVVAGQGSLESIAQFVTA